MSFMFGATAKKVDAKEAAKERTRQWKSSLRKKVRELESNVRSIERAEAKAKVDAKKAAKDGQLRGAEILAREIVRSRKSIARLQLAKSNIESLVLTIANQEGMARVAGSMADASGVMKLMNELVKVQEIRSVVQQMSKEMVKADFISEAVDEAFESLEPEEIDTDDDIQKVLSEIIGVDTSQNVSAKSGTVETAITSLPNAPSHIPEVVHAAESDDEPEIDMTEVRARMAALRAAT